MQEDMRHAQKIIKHSQNLFLPLFHRELNFCLLVMIKKFWALKHFLIMFHLGQWMPVLLIEFKIITNFVYVILDVDHNKLLIFS